MPHHTIAPLPENMVWGYLDAAVPPVLRVASGDTVALTSWAASNEARLPPDRSLVKEGHLRALRECEPGPSTHLITGPVFVEGALPGDVLQIEILEISLVDDWGWVGIRPLMGTLPEEFDAPHIIHPTIDRARGICRLPWGKELALDPFFGVIAVGTAAALGPLLVDAAPKIRRQHGQQGAARRHHALSAGASTKVRCSMPATATACRATARSA